MLALTLALALNSGCSAPPGAEQLWSRPEARILLLGEVHGTRQIPALAGELLCISQEPSRPAILALEAAPADGQREIDVYLASDGSASAKEALLRAPMWRDQVGRGTDAVLELVEVARRLGSPVVLFDTHTPVAGPTDGRREQGMADALARAAARGRVVALTGMGHADRTAFTSFGPVASAVRRLPAESVIALGPQSISGQAWSCRAEPPDTVRTCRVRSLTSRGTPAPRGVNLGSRLREGFDGVYSVGEAFAGSPPAGRPLTG